MLIKPAIPNAGWPDVDQTNSCVDAPAGQLATANHRPVALRIPPVGMHLQGLGDFVLNGAGRHLLGNLTSGYPERVMDTQQVNCPVTRPYAYMFAPSSWVRHMDL